VFPARGVDDEAAVEVVGVQALQSMAGSPAPWRLARPRPGGSAEGRQIKELCSICPRAAAPDFK
jgi:hypothetical protein